jgi:putative transposase
MKYKKWTLDQKLEILSSGEEIGIAEACRKYSLSTGDFYSGRKKFEHKGEAGLKVTYDTKSKELKELKELKEAEEENRVLRKLLSDREIELEVQRELLKKSLKRPIQERFSRCHLQET